MSLRAKEKKTWRRTQKRKKLKEHGWGFQLRPSNSSSTQKSKAVAEGGLDFERSEDEYVALFAFFGLSFWVSDRNHVVFWRWMNWVCGWMWTRFVVEGDEEIEVGDEEIRVGDEEENTEGEEWTKFTFFFIFIPMQSCIFGFGPSFLATHHLSWHISLLLPTHTLPCVSLSATTTFL